MSAGRRCTRRTKPPPVARQIAPSPSIPTLFGPAFIGNIPLLAYFIGSVASKRKFWRRPCYERMTQTSVRHQGYRKDVTTNYAPTENSSNKPNPNYWNLAVNHPLPHPKVGRASLPSNVRLLLLAHKNAWSSAHEPPSQLRLYWMP